MDSDEKSATGWGGLNGQNCSSLRSFMLIVQAVFGRCFAVFVFEGTVERRHIGVTARLGEFADFAVGKQQLADEMRDFLVAHPCRERGVEFFVKKIAEILPFNFQRSGNIFQIGVAEVYRVVAFHFRQFDDFLFYLRECHQLARIFFGVVSEIVVDIVSASNH